MRDFFVGFLLGEMCSKDGQASNYWMFYLEKNISKNKKMKHKMVESPKKNKFLTSF